MFVWLVKRRGLDLVEFLSMLQYTFLHHLHQDVQHPTYWFGTLNAQHAQAALEVEIEHKTIQSLYKVVLQVIMQTSVAILKFGC